MKAIIVFTYTIIILALATATAVEQSQGTAFALKYIYHSWWFALLWALIAMLASVAVMAKRRTMELATTMLHASLVTILLAAAVSWATSESGMMHIREGETTGYFLRNVRQMEEMPFRVRLDSFRIDHYSNSEAPRDFRSHITADGEKAVISMNHIYQKEGYRLYQSSFDDDFKGTVLSVRYDPWGTPMTYIAYVLLAISMLFWAVGESRRRKATAACGALFFVSYAIFHYSYFNTHAAPLLPVLNTPILSLHVSLIVSAYILLAVCLLLSLAYFIFSLRGKSGLQQLATALSHSLLTPALFLLISGIFVGAVWANMSWGNYWSWDPKEVWALITVMMYAIPLHHGSLKPLRRQGFYHLYIALAFMCVVMTYLGVNMLGGMHSY